MFYFSYIHWVLDYEFVFFFEVFDFKIQYMYTHIDFVDLNGELHE